MRVTCGSITEFIACLQSEKGLFQNAIRISRVTRPVVAEGENPRDAMGYEILLQVSAVVEVEGEGEYLLEAGESCGTDYLDGEPELEGTKRRELLVEELVAYSKGRGWKILPGVIDM